MWYRDLSLGEVQEVLENWNEVLAHGYDPHPAEVESMNEAHDYLMESRDDR